MSKFSEKFKELRQSRNLSQQQLADYLHTSKSSVNMYERGEREPGLEMLEAIADYFNVDMDYLIGKSDIANRTLMPNNTVERPVTIGEKMTLGERIKKMRSDAGLTQEELAKEIGYSTKTSISKIENDVLDINQSTIVALARALKTTPCVLLGWSEAEKKLPILTEHEITLVLAYRAHPSEQKAVDRILEIAEPTPQPKHLLLAGQGGSADVEIKDPEAASKELEKLQRKHGLIK